MPEKTAGANMEKKSDFENLEELKLLQS